MIKYLRFSESLPELILSGKKYATWRINDRRDISVDDLLSLCTNEGKEFAQAKVYDVKEIAFCDMTENDKEGHESYTSVREMYQIFKSYYTMDIGPETMVKVIKFRLL